MYMHVLKSYWPLVMLLQFLMHYFSIIQQLRINVHNFIQVEIY